MTGKIWSPEKRGNVKLATCFDGVDSKVLRTLSINEMAIGKYLSSRIFVYLGEYGDL